MLGVTRFGLAKMKESVLMLASVSTMPRLVLKFGFQNVFMLTSWHIYL